LSYYLITLVTNSSFASNFVAISISFTAFAFSPLLFLLIMKKYYKVAKWTVILFFIFFISFVAILTGKDSGIILFFIPGILFPTILFQRKKTILVLTSLIIGVLIVVFFINQIYNPQIITSQSELSFYFISNLMGCAIITLLVIWYFKSTNSEYEKIITEKNKRLNTYNIEINEQKLKERRFFEYLLNKLPTDVVVFNVNYKYVFINSEAISEKKKRDALIGKDAFENDNKRIPSNQIAVKRKETFNRVLKEQTTLEWEEELVFDGKKKSYLRKMSPILNENGRIDYVVGYGIDITSRVLAEKNRAALQEQILQLNASLEKEVDQKTQENIKLSEKIVDLGNKRVQLFNWDKSADQTWDILQNNIQNARKRIS